MIFISVYRCSSVVASDFSFGVSICNSAYAFVGIVFHFFQALLSFGCAQGAEFAGGKGAVFGIAAV